MSAADERALGRRRAAAEARPSASPPRRRRRPPAAPPLAVVVVALLLTGERGGGVVPPSASAYRDGGPPSSGGDLRRRKLLRRAASVRVRGVAVPPASAPPARPLAPPFPDGPCGGTITEIPPEDTFGQDSNLSGSGGNALLLPPRPVSLWLPPHYDQDTHLRHPVLYCHDGQNAVQDSLSWTGSSWRLTGALTRLAERNILRPVGDGASPLPIVVLLPSAEGDLVPGVRRRHLEYGDPTNPVAVAHADWVALSVKPLIDTLFRTVSSPSANFAIGSSLGGQASYHLLLRHPDLFRGGAAALSPAFHPSTLALAASSLSSLRSDTPALYLDNGGDVDDSKVPWFDPWDHFTEHHWWNPGYFWLDTQLQPGVDAMRMALDVGGVPYEYHREAGARHNERAWARRIDRPLRHLFGGRR